MLECLDVVKEFGGVKAVNGASFGVRQGTLTGLIGPNGAGKLTLLAMLAGTLPVTSGTIRYQGRDVTGSRPTGGPGSAWSVPSSWPASSSG